MKRKQVQEDTSIKMLKISETDEVSNSTIEPVTRVSNSLGRHFGYKLSDRKAKSNLLKGAARESLEIVQKRVCTMFLFSVGSYLEVVFPVFAQLSKCLVFLTTYYSIKKVFYSPFSFLTIFF